MQIRAPFCGSNPLATDNVRFLNRARGSIGENIDALSARSGGRPIAEIANQAGVSSSYFTRSLRLSFLAPDITRAIIRGRQPAHLTTAKLRADTRAPIDWREQRARLGLN